MLKLFLRLLPSPLFTEVLYDDVLAAHGQVKSEPAAAKLAAYRPLVARIPESARRLFATLADFVNRFVIPHNDLNKMHHANIAVIFGPVFLFRSNLSPMEELSNASRVNGAVADFFALGRDLFPEVVELPGVPRFAAAAGVAKPVQQQQQPPQPQQQLQQSVSSPMVLRMGKSLSSLSCMCFSNKKKTSFFSQGRIERPRGSRRCRNQ